MPITRDDAKEFVGGGNRELSDDERNFHADQIVAAANSYERWAETRPLTERLSTATATTRTEDGMETKTDVPLVGASAKDAISAAPEGYTAREMENPDPAPTTSDEGPNAGPTDPTATASPDANTETTTTEGNE